jgi:hypothetical protein
MDVRGDLAREVVKEDVHRAGICARQRQREGLIGSGPARGEKVEAGIALVDDARRALAALVPDACRAPLLPDPGLILAPDLDLPAGMLRRDGPEPFGQLLYGMARPSAALALS